MDMDATTFANDIPLTAAIAAHAGTSFVPEKRGEQERASYAATLAGDYAELVTYATTDEKRATLATEFARYRTGYRIRYLAHLAARSRCLSSMITGPSNFPTARNAKRNATEAKRLDDLIGYREHMIAQIKKALCSELAPIKTSDANAIDRIETKLEKLEKFQARMKEANAAIRKYAKAGADAQVAALVSLGFSESTSRELLTPDFCGRIGFADYQIKNNGAEIRRLKGRAESVAVAQAAEVATVEGSIAKLEDNPADNRVRLFYPGKPDAQTRDRLKAGGFRWTPSLGCWQAYRNTRALEIAKREAGAVEAAA